MNALLAYFALLNIADGWTTYQVLRFGGRELNPVLAKLMSKLGVYWTLVAVKVGIVLLVWWASLHGMDYRLLAAIDIGYTVLVASNYRQLRKQA